MKRTKGFLFILAAFLVIIGAFIAVTVTHLVTNKATTTKHHNNSAQAFFIASSGLQHAIQAMNSPTISQRVSCQSITGHSGFTNITLGQGQYTVTGSIVTLNNITLTANLSPTTAVIPVSSLTGFTKSGQVMIDSESINYTGSSSNSSTCLGSAPCLTGITRGAENSTATSHSTGVMVAQSRCHITSTGYVPTSANPKSKRIVSADVFGFAFGWAVGNSSGDETILSYSGNGWTNYTPPSDLPNNNINDIAMINNNDAWMVGQKEASDPLLIHWDGNDWTQFTPSNNVPNKDLNGVACVSSNDCWAVGKNKTFIHWDGTDWSNGNVDNTVPNKEINEVACPATDNCWAVGVQQLGEALMVRWDGTTWNRVIPADTEVTNGTLYDLNCTATNSCWAIGNTKKFVYWDGSNWSDVSPAADVPNSSINGISCTSASNCWAVGASGAFVHWDGTTWANVTPGADVPTSHYNNVNCMNADNCWAVGSSGSVAFWNGTEWLNDSTGLSGETLNSVIFMGSKNPASGAQVENWQEE